MKALETYWQRYFAQFVVIAYWLLGLCNNFAYVVMLSAAHDLLADHSNSSNSSTPTPPHPHNHTNKYDCNDLSTGTILLADVLPGICIKLVAPLFVHRIKYSYRVTSVIIANVLSFSLVALAPDQHAWLIFLGVCMASLGCSFGEITLLSLSTLYPRSLSISGWASGTGAAGVGGAFGYAFLTQIGLSPKVTLLSMLFIPVLMTISFICLPSPRFTQYYNDIETKTTNDANATAAANRSDGESPTPINTTSEAENKAPLITSSSSNTSKLKEFVSLMKILSKYMIPLFLVYYAEYFINQGLFELAYFRGDSVIPEHKNQYRWYSVAYQVAVFISRSSIRWIKIKYLPVFPLFQFLNVAIFLTHLFFGYIPSIWILFVVILWEGLLGGGCYVNAFYMVTNDIPKEKRELAMAITSIADSFGIALAGFTAIPVHNAICEYGNS